MKVCLCTNIFPPDIGGPATFIPYLAEVLHKRGHAVKIVAVSSQAPKHQYPYPVTVVPRSVPRAKRLALAAYHIRKAAADSDIVFANNLELPALLASKLAGKPLVLKVVGDVAWERARLSRWTNDSIGDFQVRRYGPRVEAVKWLRTLTARSAAQIVTPSRYLKTLVEGWSVPADRISVIKNALCEDQNGAAKSDRRDGARLVTVGRLVSWKGMDELIDAVGELPANFELDIIGEGPDNQSLQELVAKRGLGRRVRLAGALAPAEVKKRLAGAGIFILNSSYEGYPHVLLEAMAAGAPVIATDAGGNPEVVRHNETGWLVPTGDRTALKKAIQGLAVDDKLRSQLVQNAGKLVTDYTMQDLADAMIKLFGEVAGRNHAG